MKKNESLKLFLLIFSLMFTLPKTLLAGWVIQTVDSAGSVGVYTSLALDTSNYPHISYFDITNADLKYAKWTGVTWSIQTVDSTGNVGYYTSLVLDTSNYPHISYQDGTNGDLKYAKWTGASWSTQTVDTSGSVGLWTSIAIDANNYPHISYSDGTNADLKYAKWTGATWSIQTVDSTGNVGDFESLTLDTSNYPHISYYDATNENLKYAKWTGTSWSTQTVDSTGNVGFYTSLSLDTSNYPGISYSYYNGVNYNLKYAKWTNAPALSWTGEANYISDGLNPEIGTPSTSFIYRVKYTDPDNDAPATDYPKVHIKKDGAEISGSPYAMTYVSGNYNTGAIYSYSKNMEMSNGYSYYFEAYDVWNASATGTPASTINAVPVVSLDITAPTGAPGTPTDSGEYSAETSITFNRTASSNLSDPESGIAGYWLQVGTFPAGSGKYDANVGNALTYTITNCENGKTYYARLRARNGSGLWSDWSGNSDGITIDTTKPPEPGNVSLTPPSGTSEIKPTDTAITLTAKTEAGSDIASIVIKDQNGAVITRGVDAGAITVDANGNISGAISIADLIKTNPLLTSFTIEIKVKDKAGNISSAAVSSPLKIAAAAATPQVKLYNNLFDPTQSGQKVSIKYELPEAADVTITVYDFNGREIKKIIDRQRMPAGIQIAEWAGKNIADEIVASGTYIIYVQAGAYKTKQPVVVVK